MRKISPRVNSHKHKSKIPKNRSKLLKKVKDNSHNTSYSRIARVLASKKPESKRWSPTKTVNIKQKIILSLAILKTKRNQKMKKEVRIESQFKAMSWPLKAKLLWLGRIVPNSFWIYLQAKNYPKLDLVFKKRKVKRKYFCQLKNWLNRDCKYLQILNLGINRSARIWSNKILNIILLTID